MLKCICRHVASFFKKRGQTHLKYIDKKKKQTKEGKIGLLPIILKIIIRLGNSMFIDFFKYKLLINFFMRQQIGGRDRPSAPPLTDAECLIWK